MKNWNYWVKIIMVIQKSRQIGRFILFVLDCVAYRVGMGICMPFVHRHSFQLW